LNFLSKELNERQQQNLSAGHRCIGMGVGRRRGIIFGNYLAAAVPILGSPGQLAN